MCLGKDDDLNAVKNNDDSADEEILKKQLACMDHIIAALRAVKDKQTADEAAQVVIIEREKSNKLDRKIERSNIDTDLLWVHFRTSRILIRRIAKEADRISAHHYYDSEELRKIFDTEAPVEVIQAITPE